MVSFDFRTVSCSGYPNSGVTLSDTVTAELSSQEVNFLMDTLPLLNALMLCHAVVRGRKISRQLPARGGQRSQQVSSPLSLGVMYVKL